jgi:uncharacterized protein YbjT (DUF2867 family)
MTSVLVTGASGFIGGRLTEALAAGDVDIHVAGRNPDLLKRRWPDLTAVRMDVLDPASMAGALQDVDVAYYLVHSMSEGEHGFEERDRAAARNFAEAARAAGVRLIVYMGGLGDDADEALSPHLASRHETGRILARYGLPVLELRAGIVIGSGSASFRMMMDLVKRLPVMVTPKWVRTRTQPIAIDDVIAYLTRAAAFVPREDHTIVEIGGPDVLEYKEMMVRAARLRGRAPLILPVPVLTPRLSSLWCGLVTSVPVSVARPLIDGLRNETVVRTGDAARLFPDVHPIGFDEAVRRASVTTR